jgi:hypothetical protein
MQGWVNGGFSENKQNDHKGLEAPCLPDGVLLCGSLQEPSAHLPRHGHYNRMAQSGYTDLTVTLILSYVEPSTDGHLC